jgi:hypothetical protein
MVNKVKPKRGRLPHPIRPEPGAKAEPRQTGKAEPAAARISMRSNAGYAFYRVEEAW